jgi:predicted protein tyrosine phosphatase
LGLQTAEDPAALSALGITHVQSTMQVLLHDAPFAELVAHLPHMTQYIACALHASPKARVLVHCAMGVLRSVAVVCGYLLAGSQRYHLASSAPRIRVHTGIHTAKHTVTFPRHLPTLWHFLGKHVQGT